MRSLRLVFFFLRKLSLTVNNKKNNVTLHLKIDRILAIIALGTIVLAWFAGFSKSEADLLPALKKLIPEAGFIEFKPGRIYYAWDGNERNRLLNFIAIGSASGYGGAMDVAVVIDSSATIQALSILKHRETLSFLRRITKTDLLESIKGKTYTDKLIPGEDIEVVSGATYTSRALIDAARKALRKTAGSELGYTLPPETPQKILFGPPEMVLILLFLAGFIGKQKRFKYTKILRWISMLAGLIIIGFIFNRPLTLVFINKLLLGFFPEWQTHLYWYLLLGGILFVFTVDNKNPYCEWFCPFGAAQECFGVIGGAKLRTPDRLRYVLRWVQRGLAWLAIILALLYRNPSIASYEIFGTLFQLIGSNYQFVLLGIVLITALFIRRPWCSYLCPLRPVTDLIRLIRNWVKGNASVISVLILKTVRHM